MAQRIVVVDSLDRANESPLASPYLSPAWTGASPSIGVNLTGNNAKASAAAGAGSEFDAAVYLQPDATSGWDCSVEITLGALSTVNPFWQVGAIIHASRDSGVGDPTSTNINYHYVAVESDTLSRVSFYLGVGGVQIGTKASSWASTASVAWALAAGDVFRASVSRDKQKRDTYVFYMRHSADASFTQLGRFVLTARETDDYVPEKSQTYAGLMFYQLTSVNDVLIDRWVFTDENDSPQPQRPEISTGAWSKLMREMPVPGRPGSFD
jgi:hypothetical protein